MVKKGENIYKRKDGRWEGRYRKARNKNGKIIYGYIYGRKYSEVREKLSKKKHDYSDGSICVFQGTFAEWSNFWLETIMKEKVKPSTWTSYESKLRNHILPFLGNKKLHLLEKKDIQAFLQYLVAKNYSENTIKNILTILKSSLNYAVEHEYLIVNPCKQLGFNKKEPKKIRSLSIDRQKRLEYYALQEEGCSAVIVGLATGMRIGEICGLQWQDIDFEQNMIHVNRTLQRIPDPENLKKTKIIMNSPKTKGSYRKIPLAKNFKNYLLEKKQSSDSEYVVSSNGSFAEPRVINYRLKRTTEKAGLIPFSFHTLRHTFATRCVENGTDVSSLSKLLGHTSTKLTLDTYADSLWEKRMKAMETIDQEQFDHTL